MRPLVRIAAMPLAWTYGACVTVARGFRTRLGRASSLEVPVISVGNITTGGTGKGPIVRWIVQTLRASGARPLVALRGYRAGELGSDEALEHERLLPGTPVAVGGDRSRAIADRRRAGASYDSVVLDDGFQHWQLARDLDLVLVDATRPALDEPMLPAGPRREPLSALRRADAVVVTRATRLDPVLAARIEALHGRAPIAWCRHAWLRIDCFEASEVDGERRANAARVTAEPAAPSLGSASSVTAAWLTSRRVGVVAAIAQPQAFFDAVQASARDASWLRRARDHASFDASEVDRLRREAIAAGLDAIVTTLKDWVKIEPHWKRSCERGDAWPTVAVPIVGVEFLEGETALRALIATAWRSDARSGRPMQRE